MSRGPRPITQTDVTALAKGLRAAGFDVKRVDYDPKTGQVRFF